MAQTPEPPSIDATLGLNLPDSAEYPDDYDAPYEYSVGKFWVGFPSSHPRYGHPQGSIYWRKDTPSNDEITSRPKTYLDRLPFEVLQKILSYVTNGYSCGEDESTSGFHEAWPGSYYMWLTEPLRFAELGIWSHHDSAFFKNLVDVALIHPPLRFWIRYLKLYDHIPEEYMQPEPNSDGFNLEHCDSQQIEADYLRSAAVKIFGDGGQRLVPRVGEVFGLQMRVRFLLSLFPNIELLLFNYHQGAQDMTGWPSFNTILRQYREALSDREGKDNLNVLESQLAVDKYLASTLTPQQDANEITPVPFLANVNLLRLLFLPKINMIYGIAVEVPVSMLEQLSELHTTESNHKHDAKCLSKLNPHCLAPLFGTSPVQILMFDRSRLCFKLGCFLRLAKALKIFCYTRYEDHDEHGFHIGDLAWGLDPHQDSLEVLEVDGSYRYSGTAPKNHTHESMPYVAAGFSLERIETLHHFRRLRNVHLEYWMLTGQSHRDPEVGLTNLPESLEILYIMFSPVYPCSSECVSLGRPCEVKIRHLVEFLQKKDECFPKLRKLEVEFTHEYGSRKPSKKEKKELFATLKSLVEAKGLESFLLHFYNKPMM